MKLPQIHLYPVLWRKSLVRQALSLSPQSPLEFSKYTILSKKEAVLTGVKSGGLSFSSWYLTTKILEVERYINNCYVL